MFTVPKIGLMNDICIVGIYGGHNRTFIAYFKQIQTCRKRANKYNYFLHYFVEKS